MEWRGLRGMLWSQLCRVVAAFDQFAPDVLVRHLGGNDLARHCGKALVLDVLCDLSWLKATYLAMQIVWSMVVPGLAWRDARSFFSINTALQEC